MEKIIYNKLVRDRIPEIIKADGKTPYTHILEEEEYIQRLKEKAVEESEELKEAKTKDEVTEEIIDLYEIIDSLIDMLGLDKEEILKNQLEKAKKRGSFRDKIFLEKVV